MTYWSFIGSDFGARLSEMAAVLQRARDVRHSFVKHDAVAPDSRAAAELWFAKSSLGDEQPAMRVHRLSQLWSVVAADHMGGLAALASAREVIFSIMPLVRSSIEHSVRVIWLLDNDSDVTPIRRFARAALEELRSAEEACAAVSHLTNKQHQGYKTVREELDDLRQQVIPSSFKDFELHGGMRDWRIEGERLLSPTDVMLHFGERWGAGRVREWQGEYDALSGYTHPTLFALDFYSAMGGEAVLETDADTVSRILRAALVPFYQALRHMLAYNGWNSPEFEEWEAQLVAVFPGFLSVAQP